MIFFSGKTFTMLVTSTLLSLILVFFYMYSIVFESCKKEEKIPSNWPASLLILRIPVSAYAHYIIDNIIRMAYTILHTYILRSVWHQMDSASIFTCEKVFWIALTYNEEKIHIRIYSIGTVPPKWNNIYKTKLKS